MPFQVQIYVLRHPGSQHSDTMVCWVAPLQAAAMVPVLRAKTYLNAGRGCPPSRPAALPSSGRLAAADAPTASTSTARPRSTAALMSPSKVGRSSAASMHPRRVRRRPARPTLSAQRPALQKWLLGFRVQGGHYDRGSDAQSRQCRTLYPRLARPTLLQVHAWVYML